ncbi:hypothetical protein [Mycobacterium conspicuum]|jgi:hypothetical protein|uniref:Uncharacterized protein n=1 Tax=Mycobacterium conspicuum TaxID=44010 RepID=A0A1X1SW69_9MYCO|nr:hypothetical protein [Mycobacterium conspicuum]ORV35163.1 hypothetical protein AWC00_01125 [Mycobacterium conspicuum]BBZ42079.1 hypothetical protein MCNS_51420 [Mycobacterium conspicuum]
MLHVAALLVAGSATLDDDGALSATRIPTTCYQIDEVPLAAEIPVILVVHARAGGDYDPQLYIVAKDPAGTKRGSIQANWHWPDEDGKPSKYRCFTQNIPFEIDREGEYTIGVYYDGEGMIEMATPIPVSMMLTTTQVVATNDDSPEESLQFGGI